MNRWKSIPLLSIIFDLIERWRFRGLLGLLLAVLFLQPLAGSSLLGNVSITVLTAAVFAGAVITTREHAGGGRIGLMIVAVWATLTILAHILPGRGPEFAAAIASNVLAVVLAWATFAALFLERKADLDSLAGAIVGFFLLSVLFGHVFRALELIQPGSFALTDDGSATAELFYLSIVTITTLGYGDVLPISPTARMLAGVEAAFGTLYIAILIGRIVGALKPIEPPAGKED